MGGSTVFASPSELASASKRAKLVQLRSRSRRGRHAAGNHPDFQVLDQELFGDALARERKRAERSEQPFAVIFFTVSATGQERRWNLLTEALSQSAYATDIAGWFESNRVLGLIRPLGDDAARETEATLRSKIRGDLARHLSPDDVRRCSVRCEVYSPLVACTSPSVVSAEKRGTTQIVRDIAKRALDVLGSTTLLVVFAPVFLLVSALVKLTSKGPVFFPQERVGAGGRPFTMMKFRTMHVNADPRIHQQYVENFIQSADASAGTQRVFKIVNDPRVTPIGHFLRRSSLDELPQFWNVLKGEMSLVGPRPPVAYEVARYKTWHKRRLIEAKPGLTGLWQVTGRSRTTFDEMVRIDLRYAKSYSVWTDLKIIMATPIAMISGKGAH